jgi:hypothetical protein
VTAQDSAKGEISKSGLKAPTSPAGGAGKKMDSKVMQVPSHLVNIYLSNKSARQALTQLAPKKPVSPMQPMSSTQLHTLIHRYKEITTHKKPLKPQQPGKTPAV